MSLIAFQLHLLQCTVCRRWTRTPCPRGFELFERGASIATWANQIRAKA